WLILAAALAARLATLACVYPQNAHRVFTPDSEGYHSIALALERTGRFAPDPDHPQSPEIIRTPGYPAFLALFYKLSGERIWTALVAQILLSIVTIYLAARLASHLFGAAAGLGSALLLALDVNSHLYSQLLLTESLFGFCFLCGAIAVVHWLETPNRTNL